MRALPRCCCSSLPLLALGGAQKYEPLADSVRAASRMVADRPAPLHFAPPPTASAGWRRWTSAARRMPDRQQRLELLRTVQYEAPARLDPQLVLGVIEVESGRKYAVSRAGARGYMQVMPFWSLIGQPGHNLFHLRTNLAYGCAILRHYLDIENGDYFRALGRYNGSLGKPEYPNSVLAAWRDAGSTTARRHDRAACSSATRASPTGSTASRRPSGAPWCWSTGACTSCRAPRLDLRRRARRAAHRLDQLRAGSGSRSPSCWPGSGSPAWCTPRATSRASRSPPDAPSRCSPASRRSFGSISTAARLRPAGDPRAPPRSGLAAGGRHPGARRGGGGARGPASAAAGCRSAA